MSERFLKIKVKTLKWENSGSRFFPNVLSRALASKTYLVLQIQYLLSNANLIECNLKDIQKHITKYVNMKVITKKTIH